MPRKNPIGRIKDAASETIKDPIGTATRAAGQALGHARGTVGVGKAVAGHVTKSAAGVIAARVPGRRATPSTGAELRSVQATPAAEAPKAPVKKAPPPKKTPTRAPVTDVATELVKEQAAHQPVPPSAPAPESPIDAAAHDVHVDATPADVARTVAKKAPAKKAATKAPATKAAKKAPARKTSAASTPSGKLPPKRAARPKTAAEVVEDADLPSPVESIGSTDRS